MLFFDKTMKLKSTAKIGYEFENIADKIIKKGITSVPLRTVLTCRTEHGVCQKCYGRNLATGAIVETGEAMLMTQKTL